MPDAQNNCPDAANPGQADADGDGVGDARDADRDGDGVPNSSDNCPDAANPGQADADGDGVGDACDTHSARHILFSSARTGNSDIYVLPPGGGPPTRLTTSAAVESEPAWSPDGQRIAFTSNGGGFNVDIYVMNADGSNVTRLTTRAAVDTWNARRPRSGRRATPRSAAHRPRSAMAGRRARLALAVAGGGALVMWAGARYGDAATRRAVLAVTRLP